MAHNDRGRPQEQLDVANGVMEHRGWKGRTWGEFWSTYFWAQLIWDAALLIDFIATIGALLASFVLLCMKLEEDKNYHKWPKVNQIIENMLPFGLGKVLVVGNAFVCRIIELKQPSRTIQNNAAHVRVGKFLKASQISSAVATILSIGSFCWALNKNPWYMEKPVQMCLNATIVTTTVTKTVPSIITETVTSITTAFVTILPVGELLDI